LISAYVAVVPGIAKMVGSALYSPVIVVAALKPSTSCPDGGGGGMGKLMRGWKTSSLTTIWTQLSSKADVILRAPFS
jgi:hypothetical protein